MKTEIIEKEANSYDKALAILTADKRKVKYSQKDYNYSIEWLRRLTIKTHCVYLTSKNGCPSCNGLQKDLFNGNAYHCPYCGQKVKARENKVKVDYEKLDNSKKEDELKDNGK